MATRKSERGKSLKGRFKALCYPNKPKNIPLNVLVSLAQRNGKKVLKGANVKVLDCLWSDVCDFWVVVIGTELPMVENPSVVEEEKP